LRLFFNPHSGYLLKTIMYKYIIFLLAVVTAAGCRDARIEEHPEWERFFKEHQVQGALEYIDNNKERVLFYNKEFNSTPLTAGSTYQIFAALVAIESAVAPTEQFRIPWDEQYYSFVNGQVNVITDTNTPGYQADWSRDLTLSEAFRVNAFPYFQQLTRKITQAEMRHFIDTIKYGNRKYEGDLVNFWNNGTLLISPDEQLGLLKRLYHGELKGFTERSQRVTRALFDKKAEQDYTVYSKKFTIRHNDTIVVQYLGFVEKIKNLKNPKTGNIDPIPHPYFYVLSVYDTDPSKDLDAIADKIFGQVFTETDLKKSFDNLGE